MSESLDISVVIPTYNRSEMVCACVDSVLAQEGASFEVIVVDDCSPDDTGARMSARFGGDGRVRYMRNERNSFQTVSRNRGARVARGRHVLFLDDDNILRPGALAELLACFARHPDAGLVAPLAIHRRPGKENLIWTLGSDFNRWTSQPRDLKANLPAAELPSEPIDWPTTYSPNAFMVPRHVGEEVGWLDEGFVQIFEESDFGWKVVENGYTAWIAAHAVTEHRGFLEPGCVPELRQLGVEKPYRAYCFGRGRIRFARRHFNWLQTMSVVLVFAPLSVAWYARVALANRRPDIAWAYLKGTFAGILSIFPHCISSRFALKFTPTRQTIGGCQK
ncbi:MAG: glycosyltransferase family 2 protein [Kiritimatiellae bacterium]|nr:glycosyltransferase family 2 protein [Kiritimatiellia bacterium]